MISNTSSFMTATLCEIIHKKKNFGLKFFIGLCFIVTGMALCLYNKDDSKLLSEQRNID